MAKKGIFGVCIAGATVGLASGFVGFPVFADNPVNIKFIGYANIDYNLVFWPFFI